MIGTIDVIKQASARLHIRYRRSLEALADTELRQHWEANAATTVTALRMRADRLLTMIGVINLRQMPDALAEIYYPTPIPKPIRMTYHMILDPQHPLNDGSIRQAIMADASGGVSLDIVTSSGELLGLPHPARGQRSGIA